MITKMFSVFDSKAGVFATPFFMPTKGMAIRSFMDVSNDESTMLCKHPEDFSLFVIGEFDDEKGVVLEVAHENLGNAAGYKRSAPASLRPEFGSLSTKNGVNEAEVVR